MKENGAVCIKTLSPKGENLITLAQRDENIILFIRATALPISVYKKLRTLRDNEVITVNPNWNLKVYIYFKVAYIDGRIGSHNYTILTVLPNGKLYKADLPSWDLLLRAEKGYFNIAQRIGYNDNVPIDNPPAR